MAVHRGYLVSLGIIVLLLTAHYTTNTSRDLLHRYKTAFASDLVDDELRANAAFVVLARNNELQGLEESLHSLEARFNSKYRYPYVILNDEEFTSEFKQRIQALTRAEVNFGKIEEQDWVEPPFIDQAKASHERETANYFYAGSQSYRRMCHYQSGGFFKHPLMKKYDFYWRVEPKIKYHCDVTFDPFLYMQHNNLSYGWTLAFRELPETIRTLWAQTQGFIRKYPHLIAENNALDFVSDDNGSTYNTCHFWSNFEIGSLQFLRSEAYTKFFDHLDRSGGFFYERWGDAPVHSIAAALLLDRNQIHWFKDIGYQHDDKMNCPEDAGDRKCDCDASQSWQKLWPECYDAWKRVT